VQHVAAGPTSRNRVAPLPNLGEGDPHAMARCHAPRLSRQLGLVCGVRG
jgi:hypothetical protein